MGISSGGACFATAQEAAQYYCDTLPAGYMAFACTAVNPNATVTIRFVKSDGTQPTITRTFTTPCTEYSPAADASLYSGATVALWLAVSMSMMVIRMFRHDGN